MEIIGIMIIYLFIGGMLVGFGKNAAFKRLGVQQAMELEDLIHGVLWPTILGAAITANDEAIAYKKPKASK